MAKQNWVWNVTVIGEGRNVNEAYEDASGLLIDAARKIGAREQVVEENTDTWHTDPGGGGGGPCRPEFIDLPVRLRRANPAAQSRD